jgi:hypothetical protein
MKNKKKKFSSLKSVLILLQQLQVKYYRKIDIDIVMLGESSLAIWLGEGERIRSIVFPYNATAEELERRYKELLTRIDDRL